MECFLYTEHSAPNNKLHSVMGSSVYTSLTVNLNVLYPHTETDTRGRGRLPIAFVIVVVSKNGIIAPAESSRNSTWLATINCGGHGATTLEDQRF